MQNVIEFRNVRCVMNNSKLEDLLNQADFSKYSDLKGRLAGRLFNEKQSGKTIPFPFAALSDDDMIYVNAAQGIQPKTPDPEDPMKP